MSNPSKSMESEIVVMFADVAGSTRIYEQLGDAAAKAKIEQCLLSMIEVVENNRGKLVQTIGDEVMCRFYQVDKAADAAVLIQQSIAEASRTDSSQLKVRIGMHYGSAILEEDDIFGDVVNVAARMASIAKAGQIIMTEELTRKISPAGNIMTRLFDRVKVKGKQEELSVYEILWEQNEQTIMQPTDSQFSKKPSTLVLTYQSAKKIIKNLKTGFILGREEGKDLTVDFSFASRTHAVIEYHRGKFMFIDQSTNGTYIKDESGQEIYLKREELPLTGQGTISLGATIENNLDHLIHYDCF